jgi:hypothetical protein
MKLRLKESKSYQQGGREGGQAGEPGQSWKANAVEESVILTQRSERSSTGTSDFVT